MKTKSKGSDFNGAVKKTLNILFINSVMYNVRDYKHVVIDKSSSVSSNDVNNFALDEMNHFENGLLGTLILAKSLIFATDDSAEVFRNFDKATAVRIINDVYDIMFFALKGKNQNELDENIKNIRKRCADDLISKNTGFEMYISMNSLSGDIASYNAFDSDEAALMMTSASQLINLYTVTLLPFIMKFKNNKIKGCTADSGNKKVSLTYSPGEIFDKSFVDLIGTNDITEKIFKKQLEFFDAFEKEIQRASYKYINESTSMGLSEKRILYVAMKDLLDYPFMSNGSYDIDLKKFDKLNENRRYATSKNITIDILDKSKNIDSVEIENLDEDHIIVNVKFINQRGFLSYMNMTYSEQMRGGLVPSIEGSVDGKYFDFRFRLNRKLLDGDISGDMVSDLSNIREERDASSVGTVLLACNRVFSYIDDKTCTNALLHIEKLNYVVFSCLYIIFCDINYKGVKLYSHKITENSRGAVSRTREAFRVAHIRRLPKGYQVSDYAKSNAKRFNIVLPEGYTFVQEHLNGEEMKKIKVRG